jgi:hypothetical protein
MKNAPPERSVLAWGRKKRDRKRFCYEKVDFHFLPPL